MADVWSRLLPDCSQARICYPSWLAQRIIGGLSSYREKAVHIIGTNNDDLAMYVINYDLYTSCRCHQLYTDVDESPCCGSNDG